MKPIQNRIRKCVRCDHQWIIRDVEPKKCPKCFSPYWNKKRTRPATVKAIRKGSAY